ncbi:MAG TPA: PAS domain-containing protein [Paracoccaceae bacterium]|mgnify:FL=1|nr:PAS domain-containing protein [Paracoccaceae bacterium]HMO70705.1 PAS domain-containing protein [Paracoccaceae bacterium]
MWGSLFGGQGSSDDGRPDALRFPALAATRAYWEALRSAQGTAIPDRTRIDPRGIGGALDCAFIADRVAPGVARFRLAGSVICDLMGMDVRGMPVLSLIEPHARAALAEAVETVLTAPAILTLSLEAERGIGRPALEGRMLMLPLRRVNGEAGLALGCLALDGQIGRAPRRFAIARRLVEPLAPLPALEGMAEPASPYAPPRPAAGRPHLRLVHGGAGPRVG